MKGSSRTQLVALAGLGLVLLAVLWIQVLGSSGTDEAAPGPEPAAEAPAPGAAPGAEAPAGEAPAPAPDAAPSAESPAPAPEAATGTIEPSRGLPSAVVEAQTQGRTVVIFIHQASGIDDIVTRRALRSLQGQEGVALFSAPVAKIAAFRRITEALDLSRTPALIVLRPGSLEAPLAAAIRYGPMDETVVAQAVRDARYRGPEVPSYPHR